MTRKPLKFELNPLFSGPSLEARSKTGNPYRELSLSEIDIDPNQPRRIFDTESLNELANSIKEHGVLSPILVKLLPGGSYRLIAGERRFRASKLAGLSSIPAIVDSDENELNTLPKQLIENIQRQDLSPMERAIAIGSLKEQFSMSIREIAEKLSVSKGVVQRSLEILQLPEDLKAALLAGEAESKVLLLAKIPNSSLRKQLISKMSDFSRENLEMEIEKLLSDGKAPVDEVYHGGTPKDSNLLASDIRIIEDLKKSLSTKVQIFRSKTNPKKGKIVFEFYSNEDLSEIYQKLVS